MVKGLITGTLSGTLVSGIALLGASQFVPYVDLNAVPEAGSTAEDFNAEMPDTAPSAPEPTVGGGATAPAMPVVEPIAPLPPVETESAETPDAAELEVTLETPEEVASDTEVETSEDTIILPPPVSVRPVPPGLEETPDDTDESVVAVRETVAEDRETLETEGAQETSEPTLEAEISDEGQPEESETTDVAALDPEVETAAETDAETNAVTDAETIPENGDAEPAVPTVRPAPSSTPSLPSINPEEPSLSAPTPDVETSALDTAPSEVSTPGAPAIEAFSVPFEAEGSQPPVSIILIDKDAEAAIDFSGLPFTVAVAIDPLADNALIRMAELRAQGVEVLALTPIADGSEPADVEVAFQAFFTAVPEAIGVMDTRDTVLQKNRPRAAQVVEILKASGHGLVTYDKGFNSILQIADGAEVPAFAATRIFDDGGNDLATMKRLLDKGAFESSVAGRAVLIGDLRAETIDSLVAWSTGSKAESVELMPLSALLKAK